MMTRAPDRVGEVAREGGRRVGFSEWGSASGDPVLFVTGAGMSSSLGFGAEAVQALGLRLLCIDRAGLGRSDADPEKTFESYASDVEAVLRAQSIIRPPVVGFSQGAPFAAALAGVGLVSSVAFVSGQDELAHPRVRPKLVPDVARIIEALEADRAGFEAAFAAKADAEGLFQLVLGMSAESDRKLYEDAHFGASYLRSLREGFARGSAGYVRDLALAMGRWSSQPEDVNVPVSLWYGLRDTSPVHSPDFGETLARRFPRATLHQLEDEGGSLLWTRSREILGELVERKADAPETA